MTVDPVCVFHGKRRSEHVCLYCCLCFRSDLPVEAFHQEPDGTRVDVCESCWEGEQKELIRRRAGLFREALGESVPTGA